MLATLEVQNDKKIVKHPNPSFHIKIHMTLTTYLSCC